MLPLPICENSSERAVSSESAIAAAHGVVGDAVFIAEDLEPAIDDTEVVLTDQNRPIRLLVGLFSVVSATAVATKKRPSLFAFSGAVTFFMGANGLDLILFGNLYSFYFCMLFYHFLELDIRSLTVALSCLKKCLIEDFRIREMYYSEQLRGV